VASNGSWNESVPPDWIPVCDLLTWPGTYILQYGVVGNFEMGGFRECIALVTRRRSIYCYRASDDVYVERGQDFDTRIRRTI
jgi:hypothetical protein